MGSRLTYIRDSHDAGPSRVQLTDAGTVTTRRETPEGFLRVKARFARPGIQDYVHTDFPEGSVPDDLVGKPIRILRPAVEVFEGNALASFGGKPVTNDHPPSLVTADNYREYQVGFTAEAVGRDDKGLLVGLTIQDAQVIAAINSGKNQVSAGYSAQLFWDAGEDPDFGAYHGIQRQIRGNHVAIVDRARGGPDVSILDRAAAGGTGDKMSKRQIKGVWMEIADTDLAAVDALLAALAETDTALAALRVELDAAKAEAEAATETAEDATKAAEAAKGEADATKAAVVSDAAIAALVDERLAVLDAARKILPSIVVKDAAGAPLSLDAIRRAALAGSLKGDLTGKTAEYIAAAFDVVAATATPRGLDFAPLADGAQDDAALTARNRMLERNKKAWEIAAE